MSVTVHVVGRLTKDPVFRAAKNSNDFARFSVASNDFYNGKEQVTYKDVKVWGERAVWASKHLKKGSYVEVVGSERKELWQDKNGEEREQVIIGASIINFVSTGSNGKKSESKESSKPVEVVEYDPPEQEETDDGEEDIPF